MKDREIHQELILRKKTLVLAESCTGGAVAARLTRIPGASEFFLGSVVAYCNEWKEQFLNVQPDTLSKFGAVSAEVVEEMVLGLFMSSEADFAVAISGVLGPPEGSLYIAIGKRGEKTELVHLKAPEGREVAIEFAVEKALDALWRRIGET